MRDKKAHIAIIVLAIAVVAAIIIYVILAEILSYHKVSIDFPANITKVEIYKPGGHSHDDDNVLLNTLVQPDTVKLKSGEYILAPSGDNISDEPINITVSDDMKYSIPVIYSEEYLVWLAQAEGPLAEKALLEKYPIIKDENITVSGRLVGDGTWYIASLSKDSPSLITYDNYCVILHKTEGKWVVATTPAVVIRYDSYKDIPREIINIANQEISGGAGAGLENYSSSDQLMLPDQAHFDITMSKEDSAIIYENLKEFLFSSAEKSTAPHENQPSDGVPSHYTGETPGLRQVNHTQVGSRPMLTFTFPLNISDGRQYTVSVAYDNLSKPRAVVPVGQYYVVMLIKREGSNRPTLYINRANENHTYDNEIWAWLSASGYNRGNVNIIDKPLFTDYTY
jgi:hypothetical protein